MKEEDLNRARLRSEFKLEFHHLIILRTCLESFDRLKDAREEITKNGARKSRDSLAHETKTIEKVK